MTRTIQNEIALLGYSPTYRNEVALLGFSPTERNERSATLGATTPEGKHITLRIRSIR